MAKIKHWPREKNNSAMNKMKKVILKRLNSTWSSHWNITLEVKEHLGIKLLCVSGLNTNHPPCSNINHLIIFKVRLQFHYKTIMQNKNFFGPGGIELLKLLTRTQLQHY